jgi:hypothetical protein
MKNCLIYHHCCLGDLVYTHSVARHIIDQGYKVYWPVVGNHRLLQKYLKIDNLIWCSENDDFPMKEYYKQGKSIDLDNGDKYLALMPEADSIPTHQWMAKRHFWARDKLGIEFGDFRRNVKINRDLDREKKLIETYGLHGDYILANDIFSYLNEVELNITSDLPVHYMHVDKDIENGFNFFDWILAMQNAKEIHVVHSGLAYLVDKYCNKNKIYLYERMPKNNPDSKYEYHESIAWVFRNPNWILR